jgi:hypothetical protein
MARGPEQRVFPDSAGLARSLAEAIQAFSLEKRDRSFTIALSGGSTPKLLYELLAQDPFRDGGRGARGGTRTQHNPGSCTDDVMRNGCFAERDRYALVVHALTDHRLRESGQRFQNVMNVGTQI